MDGRNEPSRQQTRNSATLLISQLNAEQEWEKADTRESRCSEAEGALQPASNYAKPERVSCTSDVHEERRGTKNHFKEGLIEDGRSIRNPERGDLRVWLERSALAAESPSRL